MKHVLLAVLLLAATAAVGCHHGAAPTPAPADHAAAAPGGDKHMDMEHMNMPPELAKFHDLLAPRWHAEKGAERTKDTCAAVADFTASADTLVKMQPPAGADAAKWQASTKDLVAAVDGLKTACTGAADDAKFEDAFHTVHVGFHHVLEASGGEHEEGAEHGEQGEHAEHSHEM